MTLPAGKYYIGDPCYVIEDDKNWGEFCDLLRTEIEASPGYKRMKGCYEGFVFKGHVVFCHSTAFGDGEYEGTDGKFYGVDAGLLAAVPVELVEDMDEAKRLGSIVDFTGMDNAYFEDGRFYFGDLMIDTDPAQDEPEDEDEENIGDGAF